MGEEEGRQEEEEGEEGEEAEEEEKEGGPEVEEEGVVCQEGGGGGEGKGHGYLQEGVVVAGARGYRGGEERFARPGRQGRVEVHQEQEAEQRPHDQGRRESRHGDEGRVLQHVQVDGPAQQAHQVDVYGGRACLRCRRDRACAPEGGLARSLTCFALFR